MNQLIPFIFLLSTIFPISIELVNISGNNVTTLKTILREIQHPIKGEFSDSIKVEDQNRLYNLGIFSLVEIKQIDNLYQVNVVEIPRFFPLPLLDFDESKGKEGSSYGFALNVLNLNGKNRDIKIGGMYGNKIIYFLRFNDPWIIGDHISLNVQLYQFSSNKLRFLDIKDIYLLRINGFEIGSGFNIKNHNKFKFEMSLTEKELIPDNFIPFDPEFREYKNFGFGFNYSYDTRNIYNDPTVGLLFNIGLEYFLGINKSQSYSSILAELQKFTKLFEKREITLINRINFLIQNENHIPYFKIESLGGEYFIRGYNPDPTQNPNIVKNRIRASQLITQSIEIQYTLLKKKSYNNIELGLDQIWFFDIGIGGSTLNQMISNKPIMGFGVGFRTFVSGVSAIGVDFGFNPFTNSPQIHLSGG